MKEIALGHGRVALVDDEDFLRFGHLHWHAAMSKETGKGYVTRHGKVDGKWTTVYLHREILNAPPHLHVDHRNGDGLDCQKSNIRLATVSQNLCNQAPRSACGFKGVTFVRRSNKWSAAIKINGVRHHIGYYKTPEEAALAFDKRYLLERGEFAVLNFPI